jgi:DNA-binding NarL/FixJ family response regulator
MKVAQFRVLIVDDHPILRQGLSTLINGQSDLTVCAEAANGLEALVAVKAGKPDLAIVDISMNGMNGVELIKRIRMLSEPCHIIVLSMHDEMVYAERSLRAGARGYVMKQDVEGNMLLAIRKVLAGEIWVSPSMTTRLISKLVIGSETAASVSLLSDRELEVYTLIGKGSSAQEIAEELCISVRTVGSHRDHIKRKLDLKNTRALILYAGEWVKNEGLEP